MKNKQPQALQLADRISKLMPQQVCSQDLDDVADELRRLHAENVKLDHMLKIVLDGLRKQVSTMKKQQQWEDRIFGIEKRDEK